MSCIICEMTPDNKDYLLDDNGESLYWLNPKFSKTKKKLFCSAACSNKYYELSKLKE